MLLPLSHDPLPLSEHVYLNGVEQRREIDWRLYRDAGGVPNVQTLPSMEAVASDKLECRYAWLTNHARDISTNPYTPATPAVGPQVGPTFTTWPYSCNGSTDYWSPPGYTPPGYATYTAGPNNSAQVPNFAPNSDMRLTGTGFNTTTGRIVWEQVGPNGSDFGSVYMFFLRLDGCVDAYEVHYALYYGPGEGKVSADVTIVAGQVNQTPRGQVNPPAGSVFVRAMYVYGANAFLTVTYDVGYNPGA